MIDDDFVNESWRAIQSSLSFSQTGNQTDYKVNHSFWQYCIGWYCIGCYCIGCYCIGCYCIGWVSHDWTGAKALLLWILMDIETQTLKYWDWNSLRPSRHGGYREQDESGLTKSKVVETESHYCLGPSWTIFTDNSVNQSFLCGHIINILLI